MLLRDPSAECRLLGALLCEPETLGWCPDLEVDDFDDLHMRFAFMAIRNIEASGVDPNVDTVEQWLTANGHIGVDLGRVFASVFDPPYRHESLVRIDVSWLRRLSKRRGRL